MHVLSDPPLTPALTAPAPPAAKPRTQGRGRATVEGADWTRWPLVQVDRLVERLRELGVLA